MIIIVLILILIILFIVIINSKNKEINKLLTKKNYTENKITDMLKIKANLLSEICSEINKISKKKVFNNIKDLKKDYEDLMKKDNILKSTNLELKEYLLINKNFVPSDNVNFKLKELKNIEIELEAAEKYYNDIAEKHNKIISIFPYNINAKRKGLDYLYLFNIEKEILFEILKNK